MKKGSKCSEKTKRKISISHLGKIPWNKGKKCPQYSGKKHWNYGKHWSKKHRQLLGEAVKDYKHTIEARIKMSKSRKGLFTGSKNPMYKNGKKISHKYIMLLKPKHPFTQKSGYIFEHRYIMEKHLGRFLKPQEVVHHNNGIRSDNRIENLMLFSNEKAHQFHHKLCRLANSH